MREKILDGLLKRREGVSMQDIIRVVNHQLSQRGVPEVRTKDTILNDMTEISNKYHVNIEQIQDGFDRRIIRYRYEKPDFSIYAKPFTAEDDRRYRASSISCPSSKACRRWTGSETSVPISTCSLPPTMPL